MASVTSPSDSSWYPDIGSNVHLTNELSNLNMHAEDYTGALVYFPCIRVAPLCSLLMNLKLLIKKNVHFTNELSNLNMHAEDYTGTD
jgi:hypothetical protein